MHQLPGAFQVVSRRAVKTCSCEEKVAQLRLCGSCRGKRGPPGSRERQGAGKTVSAMSRLSLVQSSLKPDEPEDDLAGDVGEDRAQDSSGS